MRTEAWWTCNVCNKKVKKMKSKNIKGTLRQLWLSHRKECENSTLSMKQMKQGHS